MTFRFNLCIAMALPMLVVATAPADAKEFFIAAGSTVPGFSSNSLCEADGYGSRGCAIFGPKKSCGGYSIYVGRHAHTQMVNEYRRGDKITIRHQNTNGSFGKIICTYN